MHNDLFICSDFSSHQYVKTTNIDSKYFDSKKKSNC